MTPPRTGAIDVDAVLRQRAALLARPLQGEDTQAVDVLVFTVAGRRCAIGIDVLTEVRNLPALASLPFAAPGVVGAVHVQGRMLPVVDLAQRLHLAAAAAAAGWSKLVVVGSQRAAFGFPVDSVEGLRRVSFQAARYRAAPLEELQSRLVAGVGPDGELLLDGEQVLLAAVAGDPE